MNKSKEQTCEIKKLKLQIERLERQKANMEKVGESTDKDLQKIFKKLYDGFSSTKKKLENSTCKWNDCRQNFSDVELLFTHICTHLPDTLQDTSPHLRNYAFKWKH